MGFARIALRLGIDPGPEGMPDRCRGPRHEGVAEGGRTREAPVDPAFLATPCRDRGHARERLPFGGGRRACAWFAAGDEEPGSADRASAGEGLEQGAGGRTLGMLRDGVGKVLNRLQGGPGGVSDLLIAYQTDTPNSYRLINSPITKSCMRSVLEKQIVRRTNRLIRVRMLMCLLSIFWVFAFPIVCCSASRYRS